MSGDEPERIDDYSYTLEFSPHERGWPGVPYLGAPKTKFSPHERG